MPGIMMSSRTKSTSWCRRSKARHFEIRRLKNLGVKFPSAQDLTYTLVEQSVIIEIQDLHARIMAQPEGAQHRNAVVTPTFQGR